MPGEFVTPSAMSRNGWQAAQVGWFIQSSRPLTTAQISAAQDIAASNGLTIESRREPESTATVRIGATAATAGILAATGAVLGIASAYLVLTGIYRHDLAALSTVPYGYPGRDRGRDPAHRRSRSLGSRGTGRPRTTHGVNRHRAAAVVVPGAG